MSFLSLPADALVSTGLAKLGYRYVNIGTFQSSNKFSWFFTQAYNINVVALIYLTQETWWLLLDDCWAEISRDDKVHISQHFLQRLVPYYAFFFSLFINFLEYFRVIWCLRNPHFLLGWRLWLTMFMERDSSWEYTQMLGNLGCIRIMHTRIVLMCWIINIVVILWCALVCSYFTCSKQMPGSLGHEEQDAKTFAFWVIIFFQLGTPC